MTNCKLCKQKMDEESQEFCGKYEIDTCLNCCGKEWEENVKNGKLFHLSIPIHAN